MATPASEPDDDAPTKDQRLARPRRRRRTRRARERSSQRRRVSASERRAAAVQRRSRSARSRVARDARDATERCRRRSRPSAARCSDRAARRLGSGELARRRRRSRPSDDRRHDRADVGLEEVGAHAGHVADVVAHVVGDDRRVARVVLGDAGLDLADEVGADVGGLGVDAAADAREQRDRGGARCAKRGHDLERSWPFSPPRPRSTKRRTATLDARGARAPATLTGPSPPRRGTRAAARRDCRRTRAASAVRTFAARRRLHADEPGARPTATAPATKATAPRSRSPRWRRPAAATTTTKIDSDGVLAPQEGHRSLADGAHELAHSLVARIGPDHLPSEDGSQEQSGDSRPAAAPTYRESMRLLTSPRAPSTSSTGPRGARPGLRRWPASRVGRGETLPLADGRREAGGPTGQIKDESGARRPSSLRHRCPHLSSAGDYRSRVSVEAMAAWAAARRATGTRNGEQDT